MTPKPGRKKAKVLAEIYRQRNEKLERIEQLRLEAVALFAVARNIEKCQHYPQASRAISAIT
jgi:hypothetical protein